MPKRNTDIFKISQLQYTAHFLLLVTAAADGQTDGETDKTLRDSKDRAYASHRAVKTAL